MLVLSAAALKGGPGKSTLCHHLLGALGLTGRKILAIDCDPQSSLSTGALGTDAEQIPVGETVVSIFAGNDPLPSDVIRPSGIAGVDLIPGSRALDSYNFPDPHLAPLERQTRLRHFLEEVRDDYAMAIIDTPPNLYAVCFAALVASDFCIVPTKPMNYDVSSLSPVLEVIRQVQAGPNPSLVNLGVVLCQTEKNAIHAAFEKTLRAMHGDLIFSTPIPKSTQIGEAILAMKPVTHYKPRGASAKSFKALSDEILGRIASHSLEAAHV